MKLIANKTVILLASLGILGFSSAAIAESSGVSGSPALTVELGNLDSVSFGTLSLGGDAQATEALCVYSNADATGAYQVTFTTSETAFKLINGEHEIPYTVTYNDINAVGGELVTYNSALSAQNTSSIVEYPCTNDNALIAIDMAADDIEAVPAQAYSGTLTMVVASQ